MPEGNREPRLILCPSCGHENATYVDKCIICDFAIARYVNQPRTRPMNQARMLKDDSDAPADKKLGPLPASNLLADKQKSKKDSKRFTKCKKCDELNRIGSVTCSNCGIRLETTPDLGQPLASQADEETQTAPPPDELETQPVYEVNVGVSRASEFPIINVPQLLNEPIEDVPHGCLKFTSWMILRFDIEDYPTPIVMRPLQDKPLLIGRRHESLPVQPHIDLTPYLKEKHGVSRRHALIRLRGTRLELQDMNSTNGTSVNGVRFAPKESHQLRHEDVVMIGQIKMRVSYVQQVQSANFGRTDTLEAQ